MRAVLKIKNARGATRTCFGAYATDKGRVMVRPQHSRSCGFVADEQIDQLVPLSPPVHLSVQHSPVPLLDLDHGVLSEAARYQIARDMAGGSRGVGRNAFLVCVETEGENSCSDESREQGYSANKLWDRVVGGKRPQLTALRDPRVDVALAIRKHRRSTDI